MNFFDDLFFQTIDGCPYAFRVLDNPFLFRHIEILKVSLVKANRLTGFYQKRELRLEFQLLDLACLLHRKQYQVSIRLALAVKQVTVNFRFHVAVLGACHSSSSSKTRYGITSFNLSFACSCTSEPVSTRSSNSSNAQFAMAANCPAFSCQYFSFILFPFSPVSTLHNPSMWI